MAPVATAAAAFSTSVPTSLTDEPILPKLQAIDGHYHQSIPETSLESRARQPARLLVPVPPEMPTSR